MLRRMLECAGTGREGEAIRLGGTMHGKIYRMCGFQEQK